MSKQAIKYVSTTIDPPKSAGEISDLVRKYGGTRFEQRWTDGTLTGIRFAIQAEGIGEVPVRLEAQIERIEHILKTKSAGPLRYDARRRREQAYRIAWRQLKDFVEQALLAVETGLFPIGAAFMGHLEVYDDAARETVTMSDFLLRRAEFDAGTDGLRILPASEAPRMRALPAKVGS